MPHPITEHKKHYRTLLPCVIRGLLGALLLTFWGSRLSCPSVLCLTLARVAQLAERSIRNAEVVGSIPTEGYLAMRLCCS